MAKELSALEMNQIGNNYKWGVLYMKFQGQTEDQMYANGEQIISFFFDILFIVQTSTAFEEFLGFLGEKVTLKGFQGFRGGLDIKSNKF